MVKKITIPALIITLFTACESPEATDSSSGKGRAISIQTAITRVVGNQWENHDSIGVFQIPTGEDFSNAIAKNIAYVTPDGSGTFSSKTPLYYPDNATTNFDFIAYYPYKKDISQYYPVDVSRQSDLSALDLLYADAKNQTSDNLKVSMQFKHRLSYLKIEVKAGKDVSSLNDLRVTLKGSPTLATFDLATGNLSKNDASVQDIQLKTTINNDKLSAVSEAILIPSDRTNNSLVFDLGSQGHFTHTFTEGEFLAGKQYKLVATLSKEGTIHGVELEGLDSSIEDWDPEGGDMGSIDDNLTGSKGETPLPPVVEGGDGTQSKPYTIEQILNYKQLNIKKSFNLKGYIVAVVNINTMKVKYPPMTEDEYKSFMEGATTIPGNFLLATRAGETDPTKMIIFENVYSTKNDALQYGLPYVGKQVNFTVNLSGTITEDEKYKDICSGVKIKVSNKPLKFDK